MDFVTKLQKYTSFAYSWSTSDCKILDDVLPKQLFAANIGNVAYQIEEYKNSGLIVILDCLNGFQHNNYVHYYMYSLGKIAR